MHLITEPAVLQIQLQQPNKGKLPGTPISPLTWAMMGERAPAIRGSEVLRDCICLPGQKREAVICNKALHLTFMSWWFYSLRSKNFLSSMSKIGLKFTQITPYTQALAHLGDSTQKPVLQYIDSLLLHTTKPDQSTKKPLSPSNKQNTQPNTWRKPPHSQP